MTAHGYSFAKNMHYVALAFVKPRLLIERFQEETSLWYGIVPWALVKGLYELLYVRDHLLRTPDKGLLEQLRGGHEMLHKNTDRFSPGVREPVMDPGFITLDEHSAFENVCWTTGGHRGLRARHPFHLGFPSGVLVLARFRRERVLANFTRERMMQDVLAFYNKLLENSG